MTVAVIPARGGSKTLRRKNLLPVDGVPMVLATARAVHAAGCDVIVSTDDDQIAALVTPEFLVHWRADVPDGQTADDVARLATVDHDGAVLLVQPTVQPITAYEIVRFLRRAETGGVPVSAVIRNQHQLMRDGAWLLPRVNRQDREPLLQEVGMRWWPIVDRIGDPIRDVLTVSDSLVDIDTAADYRAVATPKRIEFQTLSQATFGRGHLHRSVSIAERLQHHHITFNGSRSLLDDWSRQFLYNRGWSTHPFVEAPDLIITDLLTHPIQNQRNVPVLSLEDEQHRGDWTVNALYEDGADWCVLRPEFLHGSYSVRDTPSKVMVMFGGTDPHGLGERVAVLMQSGTEFDVEWVQPGQDAPVAAFMRDTDLLITSAGRTVFEAAAVGVPTIVVAQNLRETTHTHVGYEHGNLFLGLGKLVTDDEILTAVEMVMTDSDLRRELSERGRPDGKGLDRIVHLVDGILGGIK